MTVRTFAVAALVVVIGTALAQPQKAPSPKPVQKASKPDMLEQLAARISVSKYNGPFLDIVENISNEYKITIMMHPLLEALDKKVVTGNYANIRLDTLLQALAQQIDGRVLVYPDHVKIIPRDIAIYESGQRTVSNDPEDIPPIPYSYLPHAAPLIKRAMVNANFKNKPLSDVINEIVESTGATVNLSTLLPADVRGTQITARFANTPVDAAIRTLCEMTECGVIEDANTLLITTRERAAARAKEDSQRLRAKQPQQALSGLGGAALQPDMTTEITKLKEQCEQLRHQLEDVQKLLSKPMRK